jgi:hypothetical protein
MQLVERGPAANPKLLAQEWTAEQLDQSAADSRILAERTQISCLVSEHGLPRASSCRDGGMNRQLQRSRSASACSAARIADQRRCAVAGIACRQIIGSNTRGDACVAPTAVELRRGLQSDLVNVIENRSSRRDGFACRPSRSRRSSMRKCARRSPAHRLRPHAR